MNLFKRIYCRIPQYGQLVLRKGDLPKGWFNDGIPDPYYSLMLRGDRRGWFGRSTFYLVFTEHCLNESFERGQINAKYMTKPVSFGRYSGIQHIDKQSKMRNSKFDCIFLSVFRYKKGGEIEDFIIALSERQFRRAIVRAKTHPNLCVKRRWWHGIYVKLYEAVGHLVNDKK